MYKDHIRHCFDEMEGVIQGYRPSVIIKPHIMCAETQLRELEKKALLADALLWAENGNYNDSIDGEHWIEVNRDGEVYGLNLEVLLNGYQASK